MAPLRWHWHNRITLALAAMVGAFAGYVFGYILYEMAVGDEGDLSFWSWAEDPWLYGSFWWAGGGAVVAVGAIYAVHII